MKKIIITTTHSIEGYRITDYLGLVTTNLVIGTDVISDFIASFSDFFGGMSGTYRDNLQLLYDRALKDIQSKAQQINANAIIGTHIDFDEISGKGKAMFMVSISGTAVTLSSKDKDEEVELKESYISRSALQKEVFLDTFNSKEYPYLSANEWDFILSNDLPEVVDKLFTIRENILAHYSDGTREEYDNNLTQYLSRQNEECATDALYRHLDRHGEFCTDYIVKHSLFSAPHIISLLNDEQVGIVLPLLSVDKDYYTNKDLDNMMHILSIFDNISPKGHIEHVKGGLLNSGGDRYICPAGHKNKPDSQFCVVSGCELDIYGFNKKERGIIEDFRKKTLILKDMLNNKR